MRFATCVNAVSLIGEWQGREWLDSAVSGVIAGLGGVLVRVNDIVLFR